MTEIDASADETCSHTDLMDEEKFALIELVHERPIIWNQEGGDRLKRKKRNLAFEEIAEIMNEKFQRSFKVDAMKLGFRLLQISFLRENKKPGSKWKFLDKMSFLLERSLPLTRSQDPVKKEVSEILDSSLKQPKDEDGTDYEEKPASASLISFFDQEMKVPAVKMRKRKVGRPPANVHQSSIDLKPQEMELLEFNNIANGKQMKFFEGLDFGHDLNHLVPSPETFTANALGLNIANMPRASTSNSTHSNVSPMKEFVPSLDDTSGSAAISQMVFNTHNKLYVNGHHLALTKFEQAISEAVNRARTYLALAQQSDGNVSDLND